MNRGFFSKEQGGGDSNGFGCFAVIGVILAAIVSWNAWHSILWAIVNGVFNWFYLIYYVLVYGWPNLGG